MLNSSKIVTHERLTPKTKVSPVIIPVIIKVPNADKGVAT